ncbi:hypothetical protein MLD38_017621 [Melastoma candidum]|uniref:Uncharacterized protein n=1 Tax=Melastoma candidum TaxID=119954 RepID=A0ACB9QVA3_9MYRT|nr:hypothetical protein MLD38_017621 [Melastoma candidum]
MGTGERIRIYRERLDQTLSSPDLRDSDTLQALVRDNLRRSSLDKSEGVCSEDLVKRRTAEVSNFLDMLRTPSVDGHGPKSGHAAHGDWKIKQDTEEFRVMYREGPQGTPFHTLLVEGYVDGPVDECLCISWESALYTKWWPQYNIPTFKITSSQCLHKIRVGEQISLVRMKVPWPLSAREALVHFFELEYLEDDLVLAMVNSIPESESIDENTHGYTREMIPDTKEVVRIGVVGGFALQKVTSGRSYFRTIANVDLKLDFVPPSLMNFVSRQLIGSGFRLYQKAVATVFNSDEDFKKALVDSMYDRIRDALFSKTKESNTAQIKEPSIIEEDLLDEDTTEPSHYDLNEIVQDLQKDSLALETPPQLGTMSENKNISSEIEELESEELSKKEITTHTNHQYVDYKRRFHLSPEVEQALGTLEKVITLVREYGLKSNAGSPRSSSYPEEEPNDVEKDSLEKSVPEDVQAFSKNEVGIEASTGDAVKAPDGLRQSSSSLSLRLKSSSSTWEANHNKITPVSPEERASMAVSADQVTLETKREDPLIPNGEENRISWRHERGNKHIAAKESNRQKRYRFCCFSGVSRNK